MTLAIIVAVGASLIDVVLLPLATPPGRATLADVCSVAPTRP
jgi:hypothetical protein